MEAARRNALARATNVLTSEGLPLDPFLSPADRRLLASSPASRGRPRSAGPGARPAWGCGPAVRAPLPAAKARIFGTAASGSPPARTPPRTRTASVSPAAAPRAQMTSSSLGPTSPRPPSPSAGGEPLSLGSAPSATEPAPAVHAASATGELTVGTEVAGDAWMTPRGNSPSDERANAPVAVGNDGRDAYTNYPRDSNTADGQSHRQPPLMRDSAVSASSSSSPPPPAAAAGSTSDTTRHVPTPSATTEAAAPRPGGGSAPPAAAEGGNPEEDARLADIDVS